MTSFPHLKPEKRKQSYQRLRTLNCFDEVYSRLCEGWSAPKVAKIIQEVHGEYEDVSRKYLINLLGAFRKTITATEVVKVRSPKFFTEKIEELEEGIDIIKEMEDLYRLQRKRIQIDFNLEENFSKLMPTMTSEMKTAADMLQRLADIRKTLGLPYKLEGGGPQADAALQLHVSENYGSQEVAEVFSDPKKRQRLTGIMKLLAKKGQAEKEPVVIDAEAEVDPDPNIEESA